MSRPKWLAVGKHSTNYQTRSQLSTSKKQNNQNYIQSPFQPNRLLELNFQTEGQLDSPLYKTSHDNNLSSQGDFPTDYNRYLLKHSSQNIFISSEGQSKFPIDGTAIRERQMNQQMKDKQRHFPVYMKHKVSSSEGLPVLIGNPHNYNIQSSVSNEQQQQSHISQQPQQQSIIIQEHQMGNDNHSQSQYSQNYNSQNQIEQLSVHESEEANYRNYQHHNQYSSAQGSEIIEAVSFNQEEGNSAHEDHSSNMNNLQSHNMKYLQIRNMNANYPSVISKESSQIKVQPLLFKNVYSRLSYQKQESGISPRNQQSDRSWTSHKVKINLSKEHHFEDYRDGQTELETKINKNNLQNNDSSKKSQMLATRIRHKLNEVKQLNNQLRVIKETIREEIEFCQSGGRMQLFLWDKLKHDKQFTDIRQKLYTGIQKTIAELASKSAIKKTQLKLSKSTISLFIPPSHNSSNNLKSTQQYYQKLNTLQSSLSISQLQCSSLTAQKQSLQQQLFTVQQQLIGVEMQIEQRVRRQLRQLQASLQTRIRQQLKPQLEQSLLNSNKTSCYTETIDTLTKQIQDLTNKCIHYQNYIIQHQQLNKQLQQQNNKQLQQQNNRQQSLEQHQHYDQLFLQKMDQLQLREEELNQVEKQLLQMDVHLKEAQDQLQQEQNLFIERENLLASKEDELDKAIQQINRKQEQLYQWQTQLEQHHTQLQQKQTQLQLQQTQLQQQQTQLEQQQTQLEQQQNTLALQQLANSPFFKHRDQKGQFPRGTFTQSIVAGNVGYNNLQPTSYHKLSKHIKTYTNKYTPLSATNNSPTQSFPTNPSAPIPNITIAGNNTLNPQIRGEKQSREQLIQQIRSKHRLLTEPLNNREYITQNKEERLTPTKNQGGGSGVNEMFSRSQAYSSTSNRPKSPILHYNLANQPHRQQRYTSSHSISIKDPSPANYYKHDRSGVYNYKQEEEYKPPYNAKKMSNSYQQLNYLPSNTSSISINNKLNSHKSPLYSPKSNQYNYRPFNSAVSQINKQTPLSSYKSFTKSPLPASTISQKLQKLKQQIKREVKQLQ